MLNEIKSKFPFEKSLFIVLIIGILIVFGIAFYIFFGFASKKIQVISPNGREALEIGQTYKLEWAARGIDKVGIVLFNGENPEWIAENINASDGGYEWTIQPGHQYGSNFWLAVFDYPWRKGSKIDYSNGSFDITYPELSNCDSLSVKNEWPYLPSDLPNMRKLFITPSVFNGNLDGLSGADAKCQQAAETLGYDGTWSAFLGGENDEDSAIKRLEKTPRSKEGIFVEAEPSSELLRGSTCHRLLGNNFQEFLARLSETELLNKEKLSDSFFADLSNVWLGRLDSSVKKNCLYIDSAYQGLNKKYSFSTCCQNWTQGSSVVAGYQEGMKLDSTFASCYTPKGEFTYAIALGAFGIGTAEDSFSPYIGKYCNSEQKLICIQN